MWAESNTAVLRVMLESSLRVCLLAGAVAAILLFARIRSGAVRHAAWCAVLAAMLLMPVLPYRVPSISLPLPWRAADVGALPAAFETAWSNPGEEPLPASRSSLPASRPVTEAPRRSLPALPLPAARVTWPVALLGIYAAGSLCLLVRLLVGWLAMTRLLRSSRLALGAARRSRDARVLECTGVVTPITAGVFRPSILLPASWSLWPEPKLEAVLAHEVAHVRRRDPLVALLARLNVCLFWFHPVAWWLERQLATTAEHACDDAGLRAMGEKRRYAEVLLDMAEAARRTGGRLSWDGVGVHGTGLLGQRIDRVLRGDLLREVSMSRKVIVALGCALAIVVVGACRQQAPALQEDPAFAAEQARTRELHQAVRNMHAAQVAEIQESLKSSPEDLTARRKLFEFTLVYDPSTPEDKGPRTHRCTHDLGDAGCTALLRSQVLWLIEHHPDSDVLGWFGRIDTSRDPEGFEQAKKLWLVQTARRDLPAPALANAAAFFEETEPAVAETMLLRAHALEPDAGWSLGLGSLYASVLRAGALRGSPAARQLPVSNPADSYVQEVRRTLDDSNDARVLSGTAHSLLGPASSAEERGLARTYAQRAVQIDPHDVRAHSVLVGLDHYYARDAPMRNALGNAPADRVDERRLSALPEAERFEFLAALAPAASYRGDLVESNHDAAGAKAARERARRYAEELLRLAPKYRDSEQYGTAIYVGNLVLAGLTFRDGNAQQAGQYLIEASKAPANDELRYTLPGWEASDVLAYMLKYGVREPVVTFLERVGRVNAANGAAMLEAAAQIRKGYRPNWYPRDTHYQQMPQLWWIAMARRSRR